MRKSRRRLHAPRGAHPADGRFRINHPGPQGLELTPCQATSSSRDRPAGSARPRRRRRPSSIACPSPGARPLAEPPPGSGLEPVMGEPGLPVVGHSLGFLQNSLELARRFHAQLRPGVLDATPSARGSCSSLGPDGIETVLANRDRAFANKEGWDYFIGPFFDRGVMLMDFEEHRHHRRIMQQAFKRERLVAYLDKMNPAIERGVAALGSRGSGFELYTARQAADARHRHRGLRRRRARRGGRPAQRRLRRHRRRRPGDRPRRRRRGGQVAPRPARAASCCEELLPQRSCRPSAQGDGDDLFSVLCHAETEDGERSPTRTSSTT